MGNWFQRIVDRDVILSEAPELAAKIRAWLVRQAVIQPEMRDCVLSGTGMGYPPGLNYWQVVEHDQGRHSPELWTNGMAIITGRTVFDCGQGGFDLICSSCQSHNLNNYAWQEAVTEWYEEKGEGMLECPFCGQAETVTEWHYDPTLSFGNLGFEFWNWEPLTAAFIADFAQQLGHRIAYIDGKL